MNFEGVWLSPLVLLVVVLVTRYFSLPDAYHPLTLFKYYIEELAKKVHPDITRSPFQQKISGFLAILVTLLPIITLCLAFYFLSELPLMLDALLLFLSLNWQQQKQKINFVAKSLESAQLNLAREQASKILLRDTSRLTEMGLSKAVLETTYLRFTRLELGTWIAFILGGGIAALSYRLIQEIAQNWNIKLPHYRYFGISIAKLANLIALPAYLITIVLLALQAGIKRSVKSIKHVKCQEFYYFTYVLLCLASTLTHANLGGPAYYDNKKVRRSRFMGEFEPSWQHVSANFRNIFNIETAFFIVLLTVFLVNLTLTHLTN